MATEAPLAGEMRDFRTVVEEHSQAMFRLAYRMTGNAADAEDVVQETFLRAYRHRGRFDPRAKVSTWLYRIAANTATDILRRRKRWRFTELDPAEEHRPLVSHDPGPDERALGLDIDERVRATLEQMSPRERLAFTLRHYEGMSSAEIAEVMGVRIGAAKNHVFRAVQKLRKALQPLAEPR